MLFVVYGNPRLKVASVTNVLPLHKSLSKDNCWSEYRSSYHFKYYYYYYLPLENDTFKYSNVIH